MAVRPAHAAVVSPATAGALGIAADGTPRIAVLSGRALTVATRSDGGWSEYAVTTLPTPDASLDGVVVDRTGRVSILAQDPAGSWLTLLRGLPGGAWKRWAIVAPNRPVGKLGAAGLALDVHGSPVVAYGFMRGSYRPSLGGVPTYARLARLSGGRMRSAPITTLGFPPSDGPPALAPVLVGGTVHVVETYVAAAIEWRPKRPRGWTGQYLFASGLGAPTGPVAAVAAQHGVWSSWTEATPETGEVHVFLNHRGGPSPRTTDLLAHGELVSLARLGGAPVVGANDWVDLGSYRDFAALVVTAAGKTVQLGGKLDALGASARGGEQVLLTGPGGLEWYVLPPRAFQVSVTAELDGSIRGSVEGATAGSVDVYRERDDGVRTRIASVPVRRNGSFDAQDAPPAVPTLYRAVYSDPASGVPYAKLTPAPVG